MVITRGGRRAERKASRAQGCHEIVCFLRHHCSHLHYDRRPYHNRFCHHHRCRLSHNRHHGHHNHHLRHRIRHHHNRCWRHLSRNRHFGHYNCHLRHDSYHHQNRHCRQNRCYRSNHRNHLTGVFDSDFFDEHIFHIFILFHVLEHEDVMLNIFVLEEAKERTHRQVAEPVRNLRMPIGRVQYLSSTVPVKYSTYQVQCLSLSSNTAGV